MAQYNFGSGTAILKRTDIANTKPARMGVLQDIELDFSVTLKELMGANKLPVDIAPATLKISGKAKFARIQADTINQLMLGLTETSASGTTMAVDEATTTATTSFTVSHGANFVEDLGVFYAASGVQLQPVASAPSTGQYVPGAAGVGTYTIAAGDENTNLNVCYTYTVTNLINLAGVNQLMGSGPVFALDLLNQYTVQGVQKTFFMKLNACRSSKLTFPFKNSDYTIQDFEFQAFADASGNWGTLALTE